MDEEKDNMRVPDQVLKCVAFIGIRDGNDPQNINYIGTGFLVSMPCENDPSLAATYLVTAAHTARKVRDRPFFIRMNFKTAGSAPLYATDLNWTFHPTDEAGVDVAVVALDLYPFLDYKLLSDSHFYDPSQPDRPIAGPGDEVFIVGLYAYAPGKEHNMPVIRIGNVAMIPDEPIEFDGMRIDAYLVEVLSLGGISGSPVFVLPQPYLMGHIQPTPRPYLFGLIKGHWNTKETNPENGDITRGNTGIAVVVPATAILETLRAPELVEARARMVAAREPIKPPPSPDTQSSQT